MVIKTLWSLSVCVVLQRCWCKSRTEKP